MKTEKIVAIISGLAVLAVVVKLVLDQKEKPESVAGSEEPVVEVVELPPLPSPNAYGILLQAADNTTKLVAEVESMSRGALEAYLAPQEDALKIVRSASEYDSRVILDGEAEFSEGHREEIDALGRLAKVYLAQALLAESKVQINDALEAYLEIIRIGTVVARGGIASNLNGGVVIDELGCQGIESLIRRLSKKSIRLAIEEIGKISAHRYNEAELLEWGLLLDQTIHKARLAALDEDQLGERQKIRKQAIEASAGQLLRMRVLQLRLALRSYEFKTGKEPESLSLLAPDHISAIPKNPTTGDLLTRADLK